MSSTEPLRQPLLDTVRTNLTHNVIAARTALELSQDKLAVRASISRATVIQIEGGEGDPRLSTLVSLADALRVPPMFLLLRPDDIRSIAQLATSTEVEMIRGELTDENLVKMRQLLGSGIARHRSKAIKMGALAATTAGAITASAVAGAAIGSILLPGIGTAIGAVLGGLLKGSSSTSLIGTLKGSKE